jgi:hypothetical protein
MGEEVKLSKEQLDLLLNKAAEAGAKKALLHLGLHDEDAGKDIRDLRELIDGWRDIKGTAVRTVVRWFIMLVLGTIAVGTYVTFNKG